MSDLHGELINVQPCELLLICGDIVPLRIQRNIPQSLKWFKETFIPFMENLPVDEIAMVGGNHDFFIEREAEACKSLLKGTKIKLLYNESYSFINKDGRNITIWGTPYCQVFGNWAFMYGEEFLLKAYSEIPENCDIVIAHQPPAMLGLGTVPPNRWHPFPVEAGNYNLANVLLERRPKYFFCGHIHEGAHGICEKDGTKFSNVSILDDTYSITYEPLYLDI